MVSGDRQTGGIIQGMHILWLDPFHGGSHAAIAQGYAQHSQHQITLLTMPITGGWRWRMRGAAVSLARQLADLQPAPDLLITTDMLDLPTLLGLARRSLPADLPVVLYMHENQLTYPLPTGRSRDLSYAWSNYTSALAADAVLFNSHFHRTSFLAALPELPSRYHDYHELDLIESLADKSYVCYPGIDLARHEQHAPAPAPDPSLPPIILWNSRWDYDKQPEQFFAALEALEAQGVAFRLIMAGDYVDPQAERFAAARRRWAHCTVHWGYAADAASYSRLLHQADLVVSTAAQEFFGISVLEAIFCGCVPVLPHRLSYPELLPPAYHAHCLYHTSADLVLRLRTTLEQISTMRDWGWRELALPYAWPQAAPRFDALLEQVADER